MGVRASSERDVLNGIVIVAFWVLWKARNNQRYNGKRCCVDEAFSEVRVVSFFFFTPQPMVESLVRGTRRIRLFKRIHNSYIAIIIITFVSPY
ncbi:hypothetical protein Hanom_Chr02g00114221 [Helianthus anomalus]